MASPHDDLDLTQAQAFTLQASDLAELLSSVDDSLSLSLAQLRAPTDAAGLHQTLHDLKGYLGLVTAASLCQRVKQADEAARHGRFEEAQGLMQPVIPRLLQLQQAVRVYRAGIIAV